MTLEGLIVEEKKLWLKMVDNEPEKNHEWWYNNGVAHGLGIAIRLLRKWEDEQDE